MTKYKYWDVYEELPEGWVIDKYGSPLSNSVFITNGKSILKGGKRAILLNKKQTIEPFKKDSGLPTFLDNLHKKEDHSNYVYPAKQMNILAREVTKKRLLEEIVIDMQICELEGWDRLQFIRELQELIDSFKINNKEE